MPEMLDFKRFKKDKRILLLEAPEQMHVWKALNAFNAHGLLCPYEAFRPDELQTVKHYMKGKLRGNFHEATLSAPDLPTPLRREMIVLNDLFNEHIGATDTPPLCRANSRYPLEPHRHRPTLAYTFAGSGTIGINEDGRQYTAPTGYIFAIDDEVLHRAAQRIPRQNPKLIILAA